jgi:hypothetical protein
MARGEQTEQARAGLTEDLVARAARRLIRRRVTVDPRDGAPISGPACRTGGGQSGQRREAGWTKSRRLLSLSLSLSLGRRARPPPRPAARARSRARPRRRTGAGGAQAPPATRICHQTGADLAARPSEIAPDGLSLFCPPPPRRAGQMAAAPPAAAARSPSPLLFWPPSSPSLSHAAQPKTHHPPQSTTTTHPTPHQTLGRQRPHVRRAPGPHVPAGQGLGHRQHVPRARGRQHQRQGPQAGQLQV